MANVYVVLPVPAGDGVGAGVNTSGLAPLKTLSIDGGPFTGTVYIEASNDNQLSWAPADVLPFTSDAQVPGQLLATVQFMRVRRTGTGPVPSGTPTVKVGAETGTNIFGAMAVPAGSGAGALIDLTLGGSVNTFNVVGGVLDGQLIIDVSDDAGTTWSPAILFDSLGKVGQNFQGIITSARVRRTFVTGSGAAPTVSVGSGDPAGGGAVAFAAPLQNFTKILPGVALTAVRSDSRTTPFPSPDSFVVYCVDYDGIVLAGNDATAQPGVAASTGVPATDMTTALNAAKLTPFKTLEEVGNQLVRWHNNATPVILVKPRAAGATYLNKAGAAQPMSFINQIAGVKRGLMRATSTFVNDTSDKLICGYQQVAGTNVAGYNAGAGTTSSLLANCTLNGGGAPGFPAEAGGSSAISIKRIRFDAATPTVALRNVCRGIWKNTLTDLTAMDNLPAVPAVNDVFFIEEPGFRLGDGGHTIALPGYNTNVQVTPCWSFAGMRATAATTTAQGEALGAVYSGFETAGSFVARGQNVQAARFYVDEIGTFQIIGTGIRADNSIQILSTVNCGIQSSGGLSTTIGSLCRWVNNMDPTFGIGCLFPLGITVTGPGTPFGSTISASTIASNTVGRGTAVTSQRLRVNTVNGQVALINSGGCAVYGVDFSNSTIASGCIKFAGAGGFFTVDDVVSPDGGNTDTIIDCSALKRGTIVVGSQAANTATATNDLRLSGGVLANFSGLSDTNYPDPAGNNVIGAAGVVSANGINLTNASGGTIAQFSVVRQNGTTAQMTSAQADTVPHATGVLGICITQPLNGGVGLVVQVGPARVNFDIPPTGGAMSYVYDGGLAGLATTTVPATVQFPLGYVEVFPGATSRAIINLIPSPMQIAAAGVLSVTAGPGITITGTATNPIVNNTGVLSVTAGSRTTVTGTAANPIVNSNRPPEPFVVGRYRNVTSNTDSKNLLPASADSITDAFGIPIDVATARVNFRINVESNVNTGGGGNTTFSLKKNGGAFINNILQIADGFTGMDDSGDTGGAFVQGDNTIITMSPGGGVTTNIVLTWALYLYD